MFKDKELKNALLSIAIPVALQNLLTSLLNMIDTVMIGSLGDRAVAAVGLANQWFFIFNLVTFGVASGSTIFIAQFFGKKDYENLQLPVAYSLFLCSAVSLIFAGLAILAPEFIMGIFTKDRETILCAVPYLKIAGISYIMMGLSLPLATAMRSTEVALIPLLITGTALLINTCLNYILINGHFGAPALGVSGAAIATSTARVFETVMIFTVMLSGKTKIRLRLRHFKPDMTFIPQYIKTILPVVGNETMWGLGISMYNVIFGHMDNAIVAANQISRNLEQLTTALCMGIASAGGVVVGKKIGEKKQNEANSYAKKFSLISCSIGTVLGILMLVLMPYYLKLYSNVSVDALGYAKILITMFGLFMFFKVYNYMAIVGILRSGGDTTFCFWLDTGSLWGVGVLGAYLSAFVFHAPFWILAFFLVAEEVVKATGAFLRFKSGKWLNDLVN